jgi:SAM-dependent methyltransferase
MAIPTPAGVSSTGHRARASRHAAATLHALPAPDGDTDQGFDAVLMISVLQHLAQPALAIREASRILRPGGRLVLSFDLACEPANFEDRQHRRSIASPARLATWLGLPETALALSPPAIRQSASELQSAGVAGMPDGLTVGGRSGGRAAAADAAAGRQAAIVAFATSPAGPDIACFSVT